MPVIKIKMPDGSLKPHEIPEGTTNAQAKAIADQVRGAAQQQGSKKEQAPKESWPDYFGSAVKRGFSDIATGASETGRNIGNLVGGMTGMPYVSQPNYQQQFGLPEEKKQNLVDKLLQISPEAGMAIATPALRVPKMIYEALTKAPGIGKLLQTLFKSKPAMEAASQGLLSTATTPENRSEAGLTTAATMAPASALSDAILSRNPSMSKFARLAGGAILGPALGAGGYEIGHQMGLPPAGAAVLGAALSPMGFMLGHRGNPSKRIPMEVAREVAKYPEAAERIAASRRLDLSHITPLEATGSGRLGAMEGKLSVNPSADAADILVRKGEQRVAGETRAIDKTLNTISNPELAEKKNKLYSESYYTKEPPFADTTKIPSEFKQKYSRTVPEDIFGLKENETFKDAEKKMLSEPEYKEAMKGVPRNSIEYLDNVKKVMGDMAYEQGRGKHSKDLIEGTQKELIKGLDNYAPAYKEARGLAERGIARQDIEDFFDKRRQEGVPMSQFLKSKEGFEELQKHLRNIPEAQQQLKDMKLVFTNLQPTLTGKGTATMYGTSMKEARSSEQAREKIFDNFLYSHDKILAELITNPKWFEELEKLRKITDREKLTGSFIKLMGRAGSQEAGKSAAK